MRHAILRFGWTTVAVIVVLALLVTSASSQTLLAPLRPADLAPVPRRDETPELPAEEPAADPLALPPIPPPPEAPRTLSGPRVRVERFEVVGSSVFRSEDFAEVLRPYLSRPIDSVDLLAARDAVTRLYVDAGYVTSGATIPDQDLAGGRVQIVVVEGTLGEIEVSGQRAFRAEYFEHRIARAARAPLDIERLESVLGRFQRDPRIERVSAVLEPGSRLGIGRLRLEVEEAYPHTASLVVGNHRSPAIGSAAMDFDAEFGNLTGFGDGLHVSGSVTEGLRVLFARYSVPIHTGDTELAGWISLGRVEIVERPFDALDLRSTSRRFGLGVRHPLLRTRDDQLWVGLAGEWLDLETKQANTDICLEPGPGSGALGCRPPRAAVLRAHAEWVHSTSREVLALKTTASVGVDALGARVRRRDDFVDGRFFSVLAQAHYARVLPETLLGSHLIVRSNLQWTDDPLFSFERFASGGRFTVRGYRENQLVTDSGINGSLELRIPLLQDSLGRHRLELAPFTDLARGWSEGPDPKSDLLWSLGLGLRAPIVEWLLVEAWWGGQLIPVDDRNRTLQDHGFHLGVRIDVP